MTTWDFISYVVLCATTAFLFWLGLQRKLSPSVGDAWQQLKDAQTKEERGWATGMLVLGLFARVLTAGYWTAVVAAITAIAAVLTPDRIWLCMAREVSRLVHLMLSMPPPELCSPGDV